MRHRIFFFLMTAIFFSVLLSSCDQKKQNPHQDVNQLIVQIETASKQSEIKKLKIKETAVHIVYDGGKLKDPFELPSSSQGGKVYPNSILRELSVDSLKLTGVVMKDDTRWAIFRENDGKLYKITVGMRVGVQQALLNKISPDQAVFLIDEAGGDEGKREIIMTLEGQK